MRETLTTTSVLETVEAARAFGRTLKPGDVVALYGDLGSGKTQFVKGVCEGLGVEDQVASPSFVMLNRYAGRDAAGREFFVYHLDLYRVKSLEEIYDIGFEEFLFGNGISLIEWAEVMTDLLPAARTDVRISFGDAETERHIEIERVTAEARPHLPGKGRDERSTR